MEQPGGAEPDSLSEKRGVDTADPADPQAVVRALIKAGKVKKKCCASQPRCKKCLVEARKKARKNVTARTESRA